MRTNSEFLQLTGALWELTQSWTFTDHCSTLSSYWWCFSWGPDAGLTTALFWLAHNSTRKLQEMPCISGSSSTCAGLHAMRSITEDYPIAFLMWQFIQSVQHATSCEQWDQGGLHFAELEENEHRLGGKPVVKEEGVSATQIRPQLRRSVAAQTAATTAEATSPPSDQHMGWAWLGATPGQGRLQISTGGAAKSHPGLDHEWQRRLPLSPIISYLMYSSSTSCSSA